MNGPKLTDDDKEIWHRVARTVSPLPGAKIALDRPLPSKGPAHTQMSFVHLAPTPAKTVKLKTDTPAIKADKHVRRGRIEIGTKIDLHDLTRDQAYPTLVRRIVRAFDRKHKCVLVVTGKGARLEGVLRASLPGWLASPDIRPMIASFAPAHIRHGGSGAFYVFLKRNNN